jgi:hypothetical protein
LLRQVDLRGLSCIDIGTQEGLVPVLMKKAGATGVFAYDRWSMSDRVEKVKSAYRVEFEYIHGQQFTALPGALKELGQPRFDVTVFSGVLYHLINPLGLLALARSLCRSTGGAFLIETAVVHSKEMSLHFNAAGKLYGQHANYFLPTTACLDYLLRMLRLQPVAALHLGHGKGGTRRVAALCRATSAVVPFDGSDDQWMGSDRFARDLANEYDIQWDEVEDPASVPIYVDDPDWLTKLGLYNAVDSSEPYQPHDDEMCLTLEQSW